jgi:hypothetical protein
MKKILVLLSALTLASCGRVADDIKLDSKTFKLPSVSGFTAKGSEFEKTARGITLIAYPKAHEIKDFDYKLNDDLFNAVFNSSYTDVSLVDGNLQFEEKQLAPYGSRMANGVDGSLSAELKIQKFAAQLVNVGDIRDRAYEAFVKNEESISALREDVQSTEASVFEELQFYKISKTPEGMEEYKRKFVLSKLDGYKVKKQKTKNCDQFLKKRLKKVATDLLTEEELALLEKSKETCKSLSATIEQIEVADTAQKSLIFDGSLISTGSIFYKGKEYITELLNELENRTNLKFLFTGIAKESVLDSTYSKDRAREGITTIRFNEEGTAFEVFSLELELGDGAETYSLENGKIQNMRIVETSSLSKMVYFTIVDETVRVDLELGATTMDRMGLRMIGDAYFTFRDGRKNRGVMKIELDSFNDKTMAFEL